MEAVVTSDPDLGPESIRAGGVSFMVGMSARRGRDGWHPTCDLTDERHSGTVVTKSKLRRYPVVSDPLTQGFGVDW